MAKNESHHQPIDNKRCPQSSLALKNNFVKGDRVMIRTLRNLLRVNGLNLFKPCEIPNIERHDLPNAVRLHDSGEPRIMNLNAAYTL